MSVETKVVAEFYSRLHPWIDHGRDVRVCQDDGGVGAAAIPDLCFYFREATEQTRIEFKTYHSRKGGIIGCTNKQIATWAAPGSDAVAPHFWIAIEDAHKFRVWCHRDDDFQQHLRSAAPASRTHHHVEVPTREPLTLASAFLTLMGNALKRQLLL